MGTPPRPVPQLPTSLIFNPNIVWDPVPWPWMDHLGIDVARELTKIRLEHQKEVLGLQAKALDKAITAINKAGR